MNAYRRVLGNIRALLETGIHVRIRMNIDTYNSEDLLKLTGEPCSGFSGMKGLSIYAHPLFGEDMPHAAIYDQTRRGPLYATIAQIHSMAGAAGFANKNTRLGGIRTNQCMADNDTSITILPDGKLGKCEHYTTKEFAGDIFHDTLDSDVIRSFKETWPDTEDCRTCPTYPTCFRLRKCEGSELCFPEIREKLVRETLDAVREQYQKLR